MKKVLYTASTYSHLKNFHLPYLRAFQEAGWEVHAACGGTPMALPYIDKLFHIPFTKSMTSPANFACVGKLSRLMRAEGYDLISTHTALAAFFTRLALPRGREKPCLINTVHGYLFGAEDTGVKKALLLGAERLTARCTDLVLTMNRADFDLAAGRRLGARVVNTPGMGVDFGRFPAQTPQSKAAARAALGLSPADFYLLYAAEFSQRKSQAFLIRALPALPPEVKCLLAGTGEELEPCKALTAQLGLEARVLFPGHVDTGPYLAAADCCVSASRSEGLPFNLMEAMAVGLPMVVSAVRGHTDLCTGPQQEFLFPTGDSAAFVRGIRRLLEDPALVEALSAHNRAESRQYALEEVRPQLLALYGLS